MSRPSLVVLLSCLAVVAWTGCAVAPNPELQAEVDTRVTAIQASDRVYQGKMPYVRLPLAVGQWAEYLAHDEEGRPYLLRQEVVGQEGDAFWIQQAVTSYFDRSMARMLVANFGHPDATKIKILKLFLRDSSGKTTDSTEAAPIIEEKILARMSFKVTGDKSTTLKVPAGVFENTLMQRIGSQDADASLSTQEWVNSEVPISGVVRARFCDGSRLQELVAFGLTGAKDEGAPSP
jgi:hypothetical protein